MSRLIDIQETNSQADKPRHINLSNQKSLVEFRQSQEDLQGILKNPKKIKESSNSSFKNLQKKHNKSEIKRNTLSSTDLKNSNMDLLGVMTDDHEQDRSVADSTLLQSTHSSQKVDFLNKVPGSGEFDVQKFEDHFKKSMKFIRFNISGEGKTIEELTKLRQAYEDDYNQKMEADNRIRDLRDQIQHHRVVHHSPKLKNLENYDTLKLKYKQLRYDRLGARVQDMKLDRFLERAKRKEKKKKKAMQNPNKNS